MKLIKIFFTSLGAITTTLLALALVAEISGAFRFSVHLDTGDRPFSRFIIEIQRCTADESRATSNFGLQVIPLDCTGIRMHNFSVMRTESVGVPPYVPETEE